MAIPAALKSRVAAVILSLSTAGAIGIMGYEGTVKVAYKDPVGIVTICSGHTATAKLGQVKTDAECAELLQKDVVYAEKGVRRLVKTPLTQPQFDALVSFVFNVGEANFASSTLLRKINANDCWGAGAEFNKWVYARGQKLPGLVKRRADERKHWETGCVKRIAQAKESPSSPHAQVRYQARRPEYAFNPLVVRASQSYTV